MKNRRWTQPVILLWAVAAPLTWSQESINDWNSVHFESGSFEVVEDLPQLLRLARLLQTNPDYKATLTGYSDGDALTPAAEKIGLQRAGAVRDLLVRFGASAAQIQILTRGARNPAASNSTKEGKFENRRVTIAVMDGNGRPVGPDIGSVEAIRPEPPAAAVSEVVDMLRGLREQNAELNAKLEAIRQQQQALESRVNSPPPLASVPAPPAVEERVILQRTNAERVNDVKFSGRSFLIGKQPEARGYGLYSYVLMARQPSDSDSDLRDRYLAFLEQYLVVPKIEEFQDLPAPPPLSQLNITYAPLKRAPDDVTAKDVLAVYNWAFAQQLIRTLRNDHPKTLSSDGPFIVSSQRALSTMDLAPSHHLFFDLSGVPPRVITLYVKAFTNQATQQRFWEKQRAQDWVLQAYSAIESGGDTLGEVEKVYAKSSFLSTILGWYPAGKK